MLNVSKLVIQSYAKVNLILEVLNKRPDNYHNINTLLERISLGDKIIIKNRRDNLIKITCNHPGVPVDASNFCFRAAKLLRDKFRIAKGLDIKIIKRIPVGAGLGGGSSNAASVFLALNKFWKLNLPKGRLAKLAAEIGSDVPFFIYAAPFAQAQGRGEKIRVLAKLNKVRLWHILVVPKIHVSTPQIYKEWDDFCGLTKPARDVKILTSALVKKNPFLNPGLLFNSLERVTLSLYPEVGRIKEKLAALGLKNILMSGSGPAVFALVSSAKAAVTLIKRVKREKRSWFVVAARTV